MGFNGVGYEGAFVLSDVALGKSHIYEESVNNSESYLNHIRIISESYPTVEFYNRDPIKISGIYSLGCEKEIVIDGVKGYFGSITIHNDLISNRYTNEYMIFDPKRINVKAIVKLPMKCVNFLKRCWYPDPPPEGFQRNS